MTGYRVALFGGFDVTLEGESIHVPVEAQRLVAYLALHEGALPRAYIAGNLWRDSDEVRARANLRSTLWRLRRHLADLVVVDAHSVVLRPGVDADVRDLYRRSRRLWHPEPAHPDDLDPQPFALEFLPGWYDEWVVAEREQIRQLRLHCLESIAETLAQHRRFGAAIQAVLTSISLDPLRESSQLQLLALHLAEGNRSEALRQYHEFAGLLQDELGLEPSAAMRELIESCGCPVAAAATRAIR